MGLSNDPKADTVTHDRTTVAWLLPTVLTTCSVAVAVAGEAGREWLRWERTAIESGEAWRIISGHIVHMGWSHLAVNAAGLVLVWLLVGDRYTWRNWIVITVATVAGIGLGFWILDPNLEWYVGLSGLLHGLLMAGIVAGLKTARKESLLIAVFVVAKLIYEQFVGPLPGSESTSGGTVVVNAHLYGAISATIVAFLILHRVRPVRPI